MTKKKVENPQEKIYKVKENASYIAFYAGFEREQKKAASNKTSLSNTITAFELEMLDIAEAVKNAADYKEYNQVVDRLKALDVAISKKKLGKKQDVYIKAQIRRTFSLVQAERKTMVSDLIKKTRKAGGNVAAGATIAGVKVGATGAKALGRGLGAAARRGTAILDDKIQSGIGNDPLLGAVYDGIRGVVSKGASVAGGVASSGFSRLSRGLGNKAKGLAARTSSPFVKKVLGAFSGDNNKNEGPVSSRMSSPSSSGSSGGGGVGTEISSELYEQTKILNVHTDLLQTISKDTSKTNKFADKTSKMQDKAARRERNKEFSDEENAFEGMSSTGGSVTGKGAKAGFLAGLFGGGKDKGDGKGGPDKEGWGSWLAGNAAELVLGGSLFGKILKPLKYLGKLKGLPGLIKAIPSAVTKIPGMTKMAAMLGTVGTGLKAAGTFGAGVGMAGLKATPGVVAAGSKLGWGGLRGAAALGAKVPKVGLLAGLGYAIDGYDAVANNASNAQSYGVSKKSAGVTDGLYTASAGLGDLLIGDRATTARGVERIGDIVQSGYDSVANLFTSENDIIKAKLEKNNGEMAELQKSLASTDPSDQDRIAQQEARIRDIKEENEKLTNKLLKEKDQENAEKGFKERFQNFFNSPWESTKSALGFGSKDSSGSSPPISSKSGPVGYQDRKIQGGKDRLAFMNNLSPEEHKLIKEYAQKYNVDPALAYAVIGQESQGKAGAVSPTGVRGLMQVTGDTGKSLLGKDFDRKDPKQNLEAGVKYLSVLRERYNDDLNQMMAEYNGGMDYAKRAASGRNYTINPSKDRENDGHYAGIMKNYEAIKQASITSSSQQAQESQKLGAEEIKLRHSMLRIRKKALESGQASMNPETMNDTKNIIKKLREGGTKEDIRNAMKDKATMQNNVSAPKITNINTQHHSHVHQSNQRHTESSLAREHEKSMGLG